SGCLEPTPASGLTDFLFVQAAVRASKTPSTAIDAIRRDIRPLRKLLCGAGSMTRPGRALARLRLRSTRLPGTAHRVDQPPRSTALRGGPTGSKLCPEAKSKGSGPTNLYLLQRSFRRCFQQILRILSWITMTEHGVARYQNFSSGPYHVAHRLQRDAAIHLDAKRQPALAANLR